MTTMIRLDEEIVATVGATRAFLAPHIEALPREDRTRRTVEHMCGWALASTDDRGGREYTDHDAIRYARWRLERASEDDSAEPG